MAHVDTENLGFFEKTPPPPHQKKKKKKRNCEIKKTKIKV